ncbi:MAG: hypothetical protein II738_04295 [Clostridia bacterium]|nr:hypothetical protein [Clostridia bacterium]
MKTCPYCGATMTDETLICPNCGRPADGAPSQTQPPYDQQPYAQQSYSQPANQQPYAQQPYAQAPNQQYQPPYGQPYYPTAPENQTLAVLALVFSFVEPIIGIILGAVGLNKLHEPKNRSMCKAGLIISIVRIVLAVILVILAFAGAGMNAYT